MTNWISVETDGSTNHVVCVILRAKPIRFMANEQLYLAIGIPCLFNAALFGIMLAYIQSRFAAIDQRFTSVDKRFDDMRDLWRAELRRVEEVLDARLKHIEEERRP